jgi:aspartate kinase
VDGVYSADPRVVPTARRIDALSYEETQEMAEAGAKVLNAQAVEFAKEKGIAIYARATQGPAPGSDPASDGTVVRRSPPRMPGTVVGVASERDLLVLDGSAPPADVLALLAELRVPGKQLHVFEGRTTVAISRENLHNEGQLRAALQTRLGGRARLVDSLAALSAIGAGINATYDNVLSGSATLAGIGIAPAGIATSSFRITWLVPNDRVNEAVRALHERYIEQQRPLVP